MNIRRKNRLWVALAVLAGLTLTTALVLYALRSSIDLFYTPGEILYGKRETQQRPERGQRLRVGGMVTPGSVKRDANSLQVSFSIYDAEGSVDVSYEGICAFSLCLLGTFLVRSGVLVSVHAFTSDPARGMFILAFMVLVIGGSLLLFAMRGYKVRSRVNNALWSRESLLLGNNVLLMAAMLTVLLGTLLPLVHKQLGLGSISIGEPFFNTMFSWMMAPFALLMGIGPLVRWGRDRPRKLRGLLVIACASTLALSLLLPWWLGDKIVAMTVVGLAMACWVFVLAGVEIALRVSRGARMTLSYWGMVAGHLGLAVTLVGIAFSQNYSVERDVRMRVGDSVDVHEYRFSFREVKEAIGPNYRSAVAVIGVMRRGEPQAILNAEKRFYHSSSAMMTEAAVDGGFTRDLYAALGEELGNGAWAVRLYYKPFVRWIWAGGVLMALGGLLCLCDPRYRPRRGYPGAEAR